MYQRMRGHEPGLAVGNLRPAGGARSEHTCILTLSCTDARAQLRQDRLLGNLHRQCIFFAAKPKRTGHATTACVEYLWHNEPEPIENRKIIGNLAQSFLMTMAVVDWSGRNVCVVGGFVGDRAGAWMGRVGVPVAIKKRFEARTDEDMPGTNRLCQSSSMAERQDGSSTTRPCT